VRRRLRLRALNYAFLGTVGSDEPDDPKEAMSMPRRTRITVTCDRRTNAWKVKGGGETHTFATKQEAVQGATAAARMLGNSQVVIHKMDGTIQSERTYGADPRRTRS
jgi:hypothetical protein